NCNGCITGIETAIAELAIGIAAPAVCGTVVKYRASVRLPRSNADYVDKPADRNRYVAICSATISELTITVSTPAKRSTSAKYGAGMNPARCYSDHIGEIADRNGNTAFENATVPELPSMVE